MEDFHLPATLVGILKLDIRHKSETVEVTILWKRATPADPKRKKTSKTTPKSTSTKTSPPTTKPTTKSTTKAFPKPSSLPKPTPPPRPPTPQRQTVPPKPPSSRTSSPASFRDNSPANSPASTPASTPSKSPPLSLINANPPPSPLEQERSSNRYDAAGKEIDHSSYPDSLAFPGGINVGLHSHNRFMAKGYKTRKIISSGHNTVFQLTKPGAELQYVNLNPHWVPQVIPWPHSTRTRTANITARLSGTNDTDQRSTRVDVVQFLMG